jgi:YD repeat-containing protein
MSFFNYTYDKNIIRKSKVETITSQVYYGEERSAGRTIYYFDKGGLLNRQAILDSNGIPKREYCFKTNARGDLVERIQKDYEFKRVDTVFYFRDYQGDKLIKDSSSLLPLAFYYDYDSKGKLLTKTINAMDGLVSVRRIILHTYDKSGRIVHIQETVYHPDFGPPGRVFSDRDIFYHKNGKVEKEVEKLDGQYSWMANAGTLNYSYDISGNLIQVTKPNGSSYVYGYDKKGLLIAIKKLMNFESDGFVEMENSFESVNKFSYTFRR